MDTKELENNLKNLDQATLGLGQTIQNMRNNISQCYTQADNLEGQAKILKAMASREENEVTAAQMYNQSFAYTNQASAYRMQAEKLQMQMEKMTSKLSGYKEMYQNYMAEGQINLVNLRTAVDKLVGVARSKYGTEKIEEALAATKQRMIYNQNLVQGCQKRISWIEQICGSTGDSYTRVRQR